VTTTKKIAAAINNFSEGELFQYNQLGIEAGEYLAAVKALGRMVNTGQIRRATAGRYYKPERSVFGELRLSEEQLLKPYLFSGNKRLAYITGESLYNRMGLTTQVPGVIKVASRDKRIITKVNNLIVKPVKSYVDVTNDNYTLLEILDAIKNFKLIPDLDIQTTLSILEERIKKLNDSDRRQLVTIALKYPPRAKALLGSILDKLNLEPALSLLLKNSLNPLSRYQFGITEQQLPGITNWNIY
jgi:hypothetical protein